VLARQQAPLSQHAAADVAQLLADLAQLAEEVLPSAGPRELANMAQGLAAGGCYSRRLMQLLLGRCDKTYVIFEGSDDAHAPCIFCSVALKGRC
jgi:hypothetical protein